MWKSLAVTGLAGALVTVAMTPLLADELFSAPTIVNLPDGQNLGAFDISFVDKRSHTYALAASRVVGSAGPLPGDVFGAVIIVDTNTNLVTQELNSPDFPFAGACSFPARNTVTGPNGVIVIDKKRDTEVWAGDGPVLTASGISRICVTTGTPPTPIHSDIAFPSSVKVFDLKTGALKTLPISTGGIGRADELCYNPVSNVVLVANDETFDNFITFIGANSYDVLHQIKFDGSDMNAGIDPETGKPIVANGIEQCIFNPRDGNFYINIPNTVKGSNMTAPGVTLRISGNAPFTVEKIFDFAQPPLSTLPPPPTTTPPIPPCTGSTGIALGPGNQLAFSCGLIIDDQTGDPIAYFPREGGADEMWFNPSDGHYFFANSTCRPQTTPPVTTTGCLGVVDAGTGTSGPSGDRVAGTAPGSHSVAADASSNQVYVPIRGNNGIAAPGPFGALCSTATDVFNIAGSDPLGCIAVYTAPSDNDDRKLNTGR
jgi:hypothetical protein